MAADAENTNMGDNMGDNVGDENMDDYDALTMAEGAPGAPEGPEGDNDGQDEAPDAGVFARMEQGIASLFNFSFMQKKTREPTQFCACHNGEVIEYA